MTSVKFYSIHLNEQPPFCDRNGGTSKILFTNSEIVNFIDETKSIKIMENRIKELNELKKPMI